MMWKTGLLVIATTLALSEALADPVPMPRPNPPGQARGIAPREETTVTMQRELVEVTLEGRRAHVKGTYWLVNTANMRETLRVGFPDVANINPSALGRFAQESFADDLKRHRSIADLKVRVDRQQEEYEYESTDTKDIYPAGWFIWTMDFQPGQKRMVTVEYESTLGWEDETRGLDEIYGIFDYWLHTGARWKGPIEKATVKVRLVGKARDTILKLSPVGASWQGDTITWEFSRFEPTTAHDIRIRCGGVTRALNPPMRVEGVLRILGDRSHPRWSHAAGRARDLGTVETLKALLEAAKKNAKPDK